MDNVEGGLKFWKYKEFDRAIRKPFLLNIPIEWINRGLSVEINHQYISRRGKG